MHLPEMAHRSRMAAARARAADNSARLDAASAEARLLRRLSQERRLARAVQRAWDDPASRTALVASADALVSEQEAWATFVRDLLDD